MAQCEEAYKKAHRAYRKDKDLLRALELFEQVIALCPEGHEFRQYALAYKNNIEIELKEEYNKTRRKEESSRDKHDYRQKKPKQEENYKTSDKEYSTQARIIICPSCGQKIKIMLPIAGDIARCIRCSAKFRISIDANGYIYITLSSGRQQKEDIHSDSSIEVDGVEECFAILEVDYKAEPSQIKSAYRKKMMEYHPDKVAKLGARLKQVAEEESKRLNAAYAILKENGYL